MRRRLRGSYDRMVAFGFDPLRGLRALLGLPAHLRELRRYVRDRRTLERQRASAPREFPFGEPRPCLGERTQQSGAVGGHYFHQDLLVARRIHRNAPRVHVDVGSRVDGFVAHVAAFRKILVIDLRPLTSRTVDLEFVQADLMEPLREDLVGCCDSLSCLHALEHFGLGRYGDRIAYDGYLVALRNFHRMLRQGGKLYLSVPIGPQRIEFNAHRVFSVAYLLECVRADYRLDHLSFVDDRGDLHEDVPIRQVDVDRNYGCTYGCGILELTKRGAPGGEAPPAGTDPRTA